MARYYGLAERPWITGDDGDYFGLPVGAIGSVDLAPVGASNWVFVTSDAPFDSAVEWRVGNGDRLEDYDLAGAELDGWNTLLGTSIAPCKLIDALWQTLTTQSDPDGELRAKPIMPTHRGMLNLYLGGHSLIRGERMPKDPTKTPHWAAIQRVVQNDYKAVYESARGGNLHRKFLGAMQLKYRLDAEAAVALLTPSRGVPRDMPMKPTTTITDSFTRADSATLGGTWTEFAGNVDILSNQARCTAANSTGRNDSALSTADHYAQIVVASVSATNLDPSVCARFHSSAATYYMFRQEIDTGEYQIYKRVAGTFTLLANTSGTGAARPYTLRGDVNGSDLELFVGGVSRLTNTDTSITANLLTGFRVNAATVDLDDFEAADFVAGGPSLGLIGGGLVGNRMGLVL